MCDSKQLDIIIVVQQCKNAAIQSTVHHIEIDEGPVQRKISLEE